ncbi:MAG: hypothetical protein ABUL72_03240, partial [Armatimonadota bacterium]
KIFGTDELPTEGENKLLDQLKSEGYDFEVYTVGMPMENDYRRLRGPVGATKFDTTKATRDEVIKAGEEVNLSKTQDSIKSTSSDGKVYFQAKAIRATSEKCTQCHAGVKVGDKVGAVVYRYWPRS